MLLLAFLAIVLALAAWCLLFWFPSAACDGCDNPPAFRNSNQGPDVGWGMYIAATVLAGVTFLVACLSGPVGSDGYTVF